MKQSIFIFLLLLNGLFSIAQKTPQPNRFLPIPTPLGVGKIDSRVDNMGYWRKMADLGYVTVEPHRGMVSATYTGSRIDNRWVMTENSTDVPVFDLSTTQSENSVFVNPGDSITVLNSNNSTDNPVTGVFGANYLITDDAGSSWSGSAGGAGGSNSGDPTTAISLDNRWYIGFIDDPGGQSVAYSTDNGTTWTAVVSGVLPPGGSLLDKNHMWIDNSPISPYEGNLYNAWTCFGGTNDAEIEVTRSTDGGLSWSTQGEISSAVSAGSHNQGVNIQTGPNGEVYVAWAIYDNWPSDETAIGMAISSDGGATYAQATRIISNIKGIRNTTTSKNHRVNSFPSMTVDISSGPYNGYIYIVWANVGVPGTNNGSDIDVYMARSIDGGSSWDTPVRVNQDPSGLGKEHYFPWITCDPVTGDLCVLYYDDRNVSSSQCEAYVSYSFDSGVTWEDFKVSDVAFTPAPIPGLAGGYMGDYLGISSRAGQVYPIWADNRSGTVMSYVSPFELSREPAANFMANDTSPCLNDTVFFQDLTTKNPISWEWLITPSSITYVNGTSAASQHPQVRFDAYADYDVRLISTNSYGSDTLFIGGYISVNNANAEFYADNTTPIINTVLTFYDASSCDIVSYLWDFGADATPASASTAGPHDVIYSSVGFKTVSLTVNDTAISTKTNYIDVRPEEYYMSNSALTVCNGTFYDSQGTSDYLNNEDYVMTFYPGDTNKAIQASFSTFSLEYQSTCSYDYLTIYNGPTTASPELGTWCGSNSPGTVVSSDPSGALTFEFHSDVSVVSSGWIASISCEDPPPPSYCTTGANTCDEYIERVQFAEIDNTSGCTTGGYHDYTSLLGVVSPGIAKTLTVTNGDLNWPSDQCGAWIDWNLDYVFDPATESISMTGSPGVGPYTASITAPTDAVAGPTRMRVRITYTGAVEPCGNTSYGEVEDYSVYIGTPGLWKGGTSGQETDWSVATNWDDHRVPTTSTNVHVPDNAGQYPELSGSVECLDLVIEDNATVKINPGTSIIIHGDLTIGPAGGGRLVIDSGSATVIGEITISSGSNIDIRSGGTLTENN